MGSLSDANRIFSTAERQLEVARQYFEPTLVKMGLGKLQIEEQTIGELNRSLERIDEAIKNHQGFGTLKLKLSADLSIVITQSRAEYQFEVGILPILLERKQEIQNRLYLLSKNNILPQTSTDSTQAEKANRKSRSSSGSKVDFVLVTALSEERDAVLAKLPGYQQLPPGKDDIRTYYQVDLPITFSDNSTGNYKIIVMSLLGMGRVQAATATADAIRRWRPRYIILVGIAGGIAAKGVQIGDILISDQIVDYELQKLTPKGPEVRWDVQRADPRLLDACNNYRSANWQELINIKRPGEGEPIRHTGPIASGDKVIAFDEVLVKYRDMWPKLIGVEMEAAGVAAVAFQSSSKPGFFMIRCVSDLADENKGSTEVEKWRAYACDVAASFAISFLKSGPVPLSRSSTPAKNKRVEILLEGEFHDFTSSRQQEIISVLAVLLRVKPSQIRILSVHQGSIRLIIEIPNSAADRLYEIVVKGDLRIFNLGIRTVLIQGRDIVEITDKAAGISPHMPEKFKNHRDLEEMRMPGIPSDLLHRIRQTLILCDEFSSQRQLNAIFAERRLRTFQAGLPEGNTISERVDLTLSYLSERRLVSGENGLVLLLEVLSERKDKADSLHGELAKLANKLLLVFQGVSDSQPPVIDEEEIISLKRQLTQYRRSLLKVEEKKASFIDPRSAPPDLEENIRLIKEKISEIETKLGLLVQATEQKPVPLTHSGITMDALMNRIDRLESVLGGKLNDIKQGQIVIYQHITTQDQIALETILGEVRLGRVEQGKLENTVDAIRRTFKHIQQAGIPIADPEIERSLNEIYLAVNSSLELQQQFELSLPVIPLLLNYKLSLGAGVDLGAVWKELKERYQRR